MIPVLAAVVRSTKNAVVKINRAMETKEPFRDVSFRRVLFAYFHMEKNVVYLKDKK